jgi:hypothetical protein
MYNASVLSHKDSINKGYKLIPLIPFQLQKRGISVEEWTEY